MAAIIGRISAANGFLSRIQGAPVLREALETQQVAAIRTAMSSTRWDANTAADVIEAINAADAISARCKDSLLELIYDSGTVFSEGPRSWSMQNFIAFPCYLTDEQWVGLSSTSELRQQVALCGTAMASLGCACASEPTYATVTSLVLLLQKGSFTSACAVTDMEKHSLFKSVVIAMKPMLKGVVARLAELPPNPLTFLETRAHEYRLAMGADAPSLNPLFPMWQIERVAATVPMRLRITKAVSTVASRVHPSEGNNILSSLTSLIQALNAGHAPGNGLGGSEIPITYLDRGSPQSGSAQDLVRRAGSAESLDEPQTPSSVPSGQWQSSLALLPAQQLKEDDIAPTQPDSDVDGAPTTEVSATATSATATSATATSATVAEPSTAKPSSTAGAGPTDATKHALEATRALQAALHARALKKPAAAHPVMAKPSAAMGKAAKLAKPAKPPKLVTLKRPAGARTGRVDHEKTRTQFLVRLPSGSVRFPYKPASADSMKVASRKAQQCLADENLDR